MSASLPLAGWTLIGIRASAQQATLRRAAQRSGGAFLGLPGLRLLPLADPVATRTALAAALACPLCLFTSPAAVRFAGKLVDLGQASTQVVAIGSGSAAALRRAGVRDVLAPRESMRSEGVLALPALLAPPARIGLVTAPGGRGELQRVLLQRGAAVVLAEVYRREPAVISRQARQRLRELQGPRAILISSGEAMRNVLAQLDTTERCQLLEASALCASSRLAGEAQALGFAEAIDCDSTRPQLQLAVLCRKLAGRQADGASGSIGI